jgi:flagellar motor switch protein FliM
MTTRQTYPLSSEKVRRLLAAVGSAYEQDRDLGPVAEYDWRDPHYFNEDQLNRLAATMSQTAAHMAEVFVHFHHGTFDVSPVSITQHFASDLPNQAEMEHDYYLPFGPEKGPPCGFAVLSRETARTWVALLLGEAGPDRNSEQTLSPLEISLLSDLTTALVESFLVPLQRHHHLQANRPLGQGQPSIQYELTEEICRIAFRVKEGGAEENAEVAFLLPGGTLAALVGQTTTAAPRVTPQEVARALMEHLLQMRVTLSARLAATSVRFREVLDLGPGDILLLGKSIEEPLELVVDDRTIFRGRPVKADGRCAVLVTQLAGHATQEVPAPKTASEPKKG